MTIANWTILAACALPILTVGLAKMASARLGREQRYNNARPREWEAAQSGWKQRAHAAQQNGFEALPLFIAGVILAQQAHADQGRIDVLAMAFIAIRLAYVAAYLMNLPSLRSLIWAAGVGCCVALLAMA